MRHRRPGLLALLGVATMAGATLAPALAADPKGGGDDPPVALHINQEALGAPSAAAMADFVAQVKLASGGSITVVPLDPDGDTPEPELAKRVVAGTQELGFVPGRAWDQAGVTSLEALQAPFLISDDSLATAVADSDVAQQMLDGMTPAGVVGLAVWPEDLRHPFSWTEPLLSPTDFAGTTVRAKDSTITFDMLRSLGANPVPQFSDAVTGAESGLRQGYSLPDGATATGNVTFFPRYDVLVANASAFASLTESQQAALRQAARTTRDDAIMARPTDVAAGVAWCAAGRGIVLASDEQVALLVAATAPIYGKLEQDAATKGFIAAIRQLKAATAPAPAAAACSPVVASPAPTATPDTTGYVGTMPPDGVYRIETATEDLIARGATTSDAANNAGTMTWTLSNGESTLHFHQATGDTDCHLPYKVVGAAVRFRFGGDACGELTENYDFVWKLDEAGLSLVLVGFDTPLGPSFARAFFQRTWTKIE